MHDIPRQNLQIEALRQQLARWEGAAWRRRTSDSGLCEEPNSLAPAPVLSSGCPALDRALPENGFRPGTLVEWLDCGEGAGTATLAFRAAASALRAAGALHGGSAVVVLDGTGEFYPLAAVAQGIEPARLIVVHPARQADYTWALDQALRCPAVAAVVAWPDGPIKAPIKGTVPLWATTMGTWRPPPGRSDGRHAAHGRGLSPLLARRLQLAVEQGGGLGLLIRPASMRSEPSWADVRLLVESLPSTSRYAAGASGRRMRVVLLRCRGGRGEQTVEVEIDHETHPLSEN